MGGGEERERESERERERERERQGEGGGERERERERESIHMCVYYISYQAKLVVKRAWRLLINRPTDEASSPPGLPCF